jgi:hypothetical protein
MLKRLALLGLLLLIPTLASADNYVSVVMDPFTFELQFRAGDATEVLGASYVWDTTTGGLSDFSLAAVGPIQGFASAPSGLFFPEPTPNYFNWVTSSGDIFQQNINIHGVPEITSTPGRYETDMWLCYGGPHCFGGQVFGRGTATVNSLGDGDRDADDPVATSEPNSMVLLAIGLLALAWLTLKVSRNSSALA